MSDRTEVIEAVGGKIHLTEREVKQPNGEMKRYLSFSNGMDVSGAYINDETVKEIIKFLKTKEVKNGK